MKYLILISALIGLSACARESGPSAAEASALGTQQSFISGTYKSNDGFTVLKFDGGLVYYESTNPIHAITISYPCSGGTCTTRDITKCLWTAKSESVLVEGLNFIIPVDTPSPTVFGCYSGSLKKSLSIAKFDESCFYLQLEGFSQQRYCK